MCPTSPFQSTLFILPWLRFSICLSSGLSWVEADCGSPIPVEWCVIPEGDWRSPLQSDLSRLLACPLPRSYNQSHWACCLPLNSPGFFLSQGMTHPGLGLTPLSFLPCLLVPAYPGESFLNFMCPPLPDPLHPTSCPHHLTHSLLTLSQATGLSRPHSDSQTLHGSKPSGEFI